MLYTQKLENCFAEKTGPNGLKRADFESNLKLVKHAKTEINTYQKGRAKAVLDIVKSNYDIDAIEKVAKNIRDNFSALVILGTGGSTLNPQSLTALRPDLNPDFKIYYADNIDPFYTKNLFDGIDIKKTAFLATSKSGGTIEVMAQVLLTIEKLEKAGIKNIGQQIFIITDPTPSNLRTIGKEIGATVLEHEGDIGGRFATFTNVSLLPALVAGLDAKEFCKGGLSVLEDFLKHDNSAAAEGAALSLTAMDAGLSISVFMPYFEAVKPFTAWVCQVWAESLGKQGKGSTPLRSVGTLDQHSQLQLYLDGPVDKLFNIIGIENNKTGPKINSHFTESLKMPELKNKTFGEINAAAQSGTISSLAKNGRAVRLFTLKQINEEALGALMMHFTLETILCAQVLQINAFDQPAVEEGKILAKKILAA